jgi:hypothetical protein
MRVVNSGVILGGTADMAGDDAPCPTAVFWAKGVGMPKTCFQYVCDYFKEDGTSVGRLPVEPDWGPALECNMFQGIRQGQCSPELGTPSGDIVPIWHAEEGKPRVMGLRVIAGPESDPVVSTISMQYFSEVAQQGAQALTEQSKLQSGEVFRYRIYAFPVASRAQSEAAGEHFVVEDIPQPLPLHAASHAAFMQHAEAHSVNDRPEDIPVFVRSAVLQEATALAREATERETGGVLLGHLYRDWSVPDLFAEITAQIPAQHTQAEHAKLTFTPATWAAVDAAIKLRGKNELLMGWWHSHPDFCHQCEPQRRQVCPLATPFFSTQDRVLHRTVFSRAFTLGLLLSHTASGIVTDLFGWRHGLIVRRGFHGLMLHTTEHLMIKKGDLHAAIKP